jgi:hypothetical protein
MMHSKQRIIPKTDLEDANQENQMIEQGLDTIGDALKEISQLLDNLENDKMLGPALKRFASDLADTVGSVAHDLNCHSSDENRRAWARAMLVDAQSELQLESSYGDQDTQSKNADDQLMHVRFQDHSAAKSLSGLSENELITAMDAAQSILFDIEDSLRNISEHDAEEVADVGLIVAKMFLWSLQSIHKQVAPNLLKGRVNSHHHHSLGIVEVLNDENEDDSIAYTTERNKFSHQQRVRCLWPPIGPTVGSLASWTVDEALKRPILSIALAMTIWPSALIGAFIGAPILAVDWCIQSGYEMLKDTSIVESAEIGASNLVQVGRFYFLCSKLMIKQSVRVGKRQIERRGGIEQVARDIGDWTLDRVLHPVSTAGMIWDGAKWCAGAAIESAAFVKDIATGEVKIPVPE